jgi:hypothetical protein
MSMLCIWGREGAIISPVEFYTTESVLIRARRKKIDYGNSRKFGT